MCDRMALEDTHLHLAESQPGKKFPALPCHRHRSPHLRAPNGTDVPRASHSARATSGIKGRTFHDWSILIQLKNILTFLNSN